MIDDLVALQQAIREARAEPTAERRQAIIDRIDLFERRVHDMGENYSFSDQIGLASIHATLPPVAAELKRWLVDGVQGLEPDSPALLDLAAKHVSPVRLQVVKAFGYANASHRTLLDRKKTRLNSSH